MRFHVVGLPHTKITKEYETCVFTDKVRKFCKMLKMEEHTVFLYSAGDANEAPCDLWTSCLPEDERVAALGGNHFIYASFDRSAPHWQRFNDNAIRAIRGHIEEQDFICVIGGKCHEPIGAAFPDNIFVEFSIGYGGVCQESFKVWESYAWMHTVYAAHAQSTNLEGQWFDAVIPGFIETEKFPYRRKPEHYYLYLGRMVGRKGYQIAQAACEKLNVRLILAGVGDEFSGYGAYFGEVGAEERGRLLSGAVALFAPTVYIEPFGSVVIEAQMCGTPVITTDWGAFPEIVTEGVTGYRCRYLGEFMRAAKAARLLPRDNIRTKAVARWSLHAVAPQYTRYFERLSLLHKDGVNTVDVSHTP